MARWGNREESEGEVEVLSMTHQPVIELNI